MKHGNEQAVTANQLVGPARHAEIASHTATPICSAWWMKHLALLTLLQAACLAVGLQSTQLTSSTGGEALHGESTGSETSTAASTEPLPLTQLSLVQAALSCLIFGRMHHRWRNQQQQSEADLKQYRVALSRTQNAVVIGLTHLAESRDADTDGHLDRVGQFAACLAAGAASHPEFADEITGDFVRLIQFSSALHDIGKVGIEDSILQKPGRLTDDERRRMQKHTAISSRCLNRIEACLGDANFLQMAHQIALFHHEWWDGSGYPTGLLGNQIPLAARIVAIADVYDALSARRVYKNAYPHEDCVAIIEAGSGTQFDPRLVQVFLSVQAEFAAITLEDGDVAPNFRPARRAASTSSDRLDSILVEVEEAVASASC